jgi:hypothetical protein
MLRRRLLISNSSDSDIEVSIPIVHLDAVVEPERFTILDNDMLLYNPPGDYEFGVMYPIHELMAYYENNYLSTSDKTLNLYNNEFEINTDIHGGISIYTITFINDRITIVGYDEQENPWHGTIVNEFDIMQINGSEYSVLPGSVYFRRVFPVTESQQYIWRNDWAGEATEEYIIACDSDIDRYSITPATALVEWYNIVINDNILEFADYSGYSLTIQGKAFGSTHRINIRGMYGYDYDNYGGNISITGMDNNYHEWSGYLAIQDGNVFMNGDAYPVYVGDIFMKRYIPQ